MIRAESIRFASISMMNGHVGVWSSSHVWAMMRLCVCLGSLIWLKYRSCHIKKEECRKWAVMGVYTFLAAPAVIHVKQNSTFSWQIFYSVFHMEPLRLLKPACSKTLISIPIPHLWLLLIINLAANSFIGWHSLPPPYFSQMIFSLYQLQ